MRDPQAIRCVEIVGELDTPDGPLTVRCDAEIEVVDIVSLPCAGGDGSIELLTTLCKAERPHRISHEIGSLVGHGLVLPDGTLL